MYVIKIVLVHTYHMRVLRKSKDSDLAEDPISGTSTIKHYAKSVGTSDP